MMRTLTALAVIGTVATATVAVPTSADARGRGVGVAAGIIGGIAAGALIAGAANGYYGPHYYAYGPAPAYYPSCFWRRERVWNGWNWHWARVRVCY